MLLTHNSKFNFLIFLIRNIKLKFAELLNKKLYIIFPDLSYINLDSDDYYDESKDNRSSGQYKYSQSEYDSYGNKILTESQKKSNEYASMTYEQLQKIKENLGFPARFDTDLIETMKIKKGVIENRKIEEETERRKKDDEPGYLSYLAFLPILPFYAVYKGVEFITDLIDE